MPRFPHSPSMQGRQKSVPGGMVSELEIADVQPEASPHPRDDRYNIDVTAGKNGHTKPGHHIGRAVDDAIALEKRLDRRQVIDQHHRLVAIGTEIEVDCRPLPIDVMLAGAQFRQGPVAAA